MWLRKLGLFHKTFMLNMNFASFTHPLYRQMPYHRWWPVIHTVTWLGKCRVSTRNILNNQLWIQMRWVLSKFWIRMSEIRSDSAHLFIEQNLDYLLWPFLTLFKSQELSRVMTLGSEGHSWTFPPVLWSLSSCFWTHMDSSPSLPFQGWSCFQCLLLPLVILLFSIWLPLPLLKVSSLDTQACNVPHCFSLHHIIMVTEASRKLSKEKD